MTDENFNNQHWIVTRRIFLKSSAAALAGLALTPISCTGPTGSGRRRGAVRFGIVTDCHYADADTAGTRFYRHSLDKLGECVEVMNRLQVEFIVELGDFKDQQNPPVEQNTLSYLRAVEGVFSQFNGPAYHVLGNHDQDSLSKAQFLANVKNTGIDPDRSYYSFDFSGVHLVVLDANYKSDGTDYDHGNFDWTDANVPPADSHYVKNAAEVRQILEQSDRIMAVFQGHRHDGGYSFIEKIHYYTLKAVIEGPGPENNSYAVVEVRPDMSITVTGYRKAVSDQLSPV